MNFLFSESLRSINDSTWLQLQLMYFVNESHEESNSAPLTKEKTMETSDIYLFFSVLQVPFFYKHSTNNAQTCNKYVDRKGMSLNWHGLLWAERLWAEFTRDFCLLPRFLTLNNFAWLSTPMPTECLCPCQQNVYAIANRSFAHFRHVLFVIVLLVPGFLSTSILYYVESQKPC